MPLKNTKVELVYILTFNRYTVYDLPNLKFVYPYIIKQNYRYLLKNVYQCVFHKKKKLNLYHKLFLKLCFKIVI